MAGMLYNNLGGTTSKTFYVGGPKGIKLEVEVEETSEGKCYIKTIYADKIKLAGDNYIALESDKYKFTGISAESEDADKLGGKLPEFYAKQSDLDITDKKSISSLDVSVNEENYKISFDLKDANGNSIKTATGDTPEIDLPVESVVVGGEVVTDENGKRVIRLKLVNDKTIDVDVTDIIAASQAIINENNKLPGQFINYDGAEGYTKESLGLDKVQNTADLDKPISTATQAAITAEINRAETAENAISSSLNAEIKAREDLGTDLNQKISDEVSRAQNAESALSDKVDTKLDRVDTSGTHKRVYTIETNGTQSVCNLTSDSLQNSVPLRDNTKNFKIAEPTSDEYCANKKYVDDKFVAKVTSAGVSRVYGVSSNGNQKIFKVANEASEANSIAQRDSKGDLVANTFKGNVESNTVTINNTPTDDSHAATKKYVDDSLKNSLDPNYVHTDNNYTTEEKNKVATIDDKVDKVDGMGLSHNDFSDDYKTEVDNNTAARHSHNNKSILDAITVAFTDADYVHTDNNFTSELKERVENSVLDTDYRLTDARAPLAHTHSHSDITDWDTATSGFLTEHQDISGKANVTETGYSLDVSLDESNYKLTIKLKNKEGLELSTKEIDLPIENLVQSASYDKTTKEIVLHLVNEGTNHDNDIRFSVADLVSGLQNEITSENKLSANLVSGLSAVATSNSYNDLDNKPFIPSELGDLTGVSDLVHDSNYSVLKSKVEGIEEGAQKNTITGIKGSEETEFRTGNVSISKSDIGLGNVTNVSTTSNLAKDSLENITSGAVYDALQEKVDVTDARLSDARTPLAHTHTKSEITDFGSYIPSSGGELTGILSMSEEGQIKGGAIDTHPENSGTMLAYYANDLTNLVLRGGTARITNVTQNLDITPSDYNNLFDGTPSYLSYQVTALDDVIEIYIDITNSTPSSYSWSTQFGIGFGAAIWGAKSVKIEAGRKTENGTVWKTVYDKTTSNFIGIHNILSSGPGTSDTAIGDDGTAITGNSSNTWNVLKYTLTGFNTLNPRIAQIWTINYSSKGLAENFLQKSGGEVFDVIYPYKTDTVDLGRLGKPWLNTYSKFYYEDGKKLSEKYANIEHTHVLSDVSGLSTELEKYQTKISSTNKIDYEYISLPSGKIPKSDLASDVQASLGKADTALQEHQDISGKVDNTEDGINSALNKLSAASEVPSDNDYFISQYANGGDSETTYHRRPVSKLYDYMNGKLVDVYAAKSHNHTHSDITDWNTATSGFLTEHQDISGKANESETGYSLDVSLDNETYTLTIKLKNKAGAELSSKTIDFPIESLIQSATYDNATKELVLHLKVEGENHKNDIRVSIADLITGLQNEITESNKLPASLVSGLATVATTGSYENLTNKPNIPSALGDLTGTDDLVHDSNYSVLKSKVDSIEAGAQINTITGIKGSEETDFRTGNVSISKSDIGLGAVTNVSTINYLSSNSKNNVTSAAVYNGLLHKVNLEEDSNTNERYSDSDVDYVLVKSYANRGIHGGIGSLPAGTSSDGTAIYKTYLTQYYNNGIRIFDKEVDDATQPNGLATVSRLLFPNLNGASSFIATEDYVVGKVNSVKSALDLKADKKDVSEIDINLEGTGTTASIPENTTGYGSIVELSGKSYKSENLLVLEDKAETTINGITYSINNGTITLNGTASDNIIISLIPSISLNGTYYSYTFGRTDNVYTLFFRIEDNYWFDTNTSFVSNNNSWYVRLDIKQGATFNNYSVSPMLVNGSTAPTEFSKGFEGIKVEYPTNVKVVGTNLLNIADKEAITTNGITYSIKNGVLTLNGTATDDTLLHIGSISGIKLNDIFTVKTFNSNVYFQYAFYNNDTWLITSNKFIDNATMQVSNENANRIELLVNISNNETISNSVSKLMIVRGSTAPTTFKPYTEQNLSQTNIINYVSNNLQTNHSWTSENASKWLGLGVSDSNIIDYANKKAIIKYGIVDLGTLSWTYRSSDGLYGANLSNSKAYSTDIVANAICSRFEIVSRNNMVDKTFSINNEKSLCAFNTSYTNATDFKTAMSGIMLIYELATPIEIDISEIESEAHFECESNGTIIHNSITNYKYSFPVSLKGQVELNFEHDKEQQRDIDDLYRQINSINTTIGDISAILDNINGEVI